MQLRIKNVHNIKINKFIDFLIPQMQKYAIGRIDKEQLKGFDAYFESNKKAFTNETKRKFITYDLIVAAFYNLVAEKQGQDTIIKIESNQIIPYTRLTFDTFSRLINYGNQVVTGYSIFDTVFKYFANHLEEYYTAFTLRGN